MKFLLALLMTGFVFGAPGARAGCLPVDVRFDARLQAVDATLTLPPSVDRVELRDLAPYRRTALWTSPDGSARIAETSVKPAVSGRRTLHLRMNVQAQVPMEDRAYAPFQRFADGTVAVYAPLFLAPGDAAVRLCPRWHPAAGEQVLGYGRAQSTTLATDMARPEGYVAFGHPRVLHHGALMLVSDRLTPDWVQARIAALAPALVDRYTKAMGPATVPMLFLFTRPTPHGVHDYKGDHLPASITLDLFGDGWGKVDEVNAGELSRFLAHELFHSWNSGALLGSPEGEALLAKEGGADMAKIFVIANISGQSKQDVLDAVAQAYDACLLELPNGSSLAEPLGKLGPGHLPYDCGVPLMYALAVGADPAHPDHGYFGLWRKLREAHERHSVGGYGWQDLMPRQLPAGVRTGLVKAVTQPDGYPAGLRAVWSTLGLGVHTETTMDVTGRRAYARRLMSHLMAQDCNGSVSFWNEPDGIRLDRPLPRCHTLRPGAMVISILGEPLAHADMEGLAQRVRALCAAGAEVAIGYVGEGGRAAPPESDVRCAAALPVWGQPVRLTALP